MGWMTQLQGAAVRYTSVDFGFWAAWSTDSYGQNGNGNGLLTVPPAFWPLTCGFRSHSHHMGWSLADHRPSGRGTRDAGALAWLTTPCAAVLLQRTRTPLIGQHRPEALFHARHESSLHTFGGAATGAKEGQPRHPGHLVK